MKKLFLSLIAVAVGTMGSYAQSDLVATLSHSSTLTNYYGADALSEAYTAASAGDVITLSPGTFNAVDIEKAITIRGAGMIPMETNGYASTQISGNFNINVPSSTTPVLTLEGVEALGKVYISGDDLVPINVFRSRFIDGVTGTGINMNAYFCTFGALNATVGNSYSSSYKNTTFNCYNCVINDASSSGYNPYNSPQVMGKIVATNCFVVLSGTSVDYSIFTNCIIASDDGTYQGPLPETASAQNCIGINSRNVPDLFVNLISASNTMVEGSGETAYSNVFKTLKKMEYASNISYAETFELTPTAAATYLGDDGTQVGIYGGTNPFNPTPLNPQISGFTVNTSTNNGSLSVTINVE